MQQINWNNQIHFTLETKAISSGRPYINKKTGGVYMTPSYTIFANKIEEVMKEDIGDILIKDFQHKIEKSNGFKVYIKVGYATKQDDFWGYPKIVRPDIDNVQKPLFDQVLGRLGVNDEQIFSVTCEKEYASRDYIHFVIDMYDIKKLQRPKLTEKQKEEKRLKRLKSEVKKILE